MKTLLSVVCLCLGLSARTSFAERRGFTVRDSIEMTRFDDPWELQKDPEAKFSPDARYFIVVTSRGLLGSNQIESTLRLFDTKAVEDFVNSRDSIMEPPPCILVRHSETPRIISHVPYTSVITDVRWSDDSKALYFLGENARSERQLFRVDIGTKKLVSLSQAGRDVTTYVLRDSSIIFVAWREPANPSDAIWRPQDEGGENAGKSVTGLPIGNILFPQQSRHPRVRELWVSRDGRVARMVGHSPFEFAPDLDNGLFSVAPGGRKVVQLLPVKQRDSSWLSYLPASGTDMGAVSLDDPRSVSPFNPNRLRVYALTDLDEGLTIPLPSTPFGAALGYPDREQVVWSKDGGRVLLANVFLPLTNIGDEERHRRMLPCAVAEIELRSRDAHCIVYQQSSGATSQEPSPLIQVDTVAYGSDESEAIIDISRPQGGHESIRYRRNGKEWTSVESASASPGPRELNDAASRKRALKVTIVQSANDLPTLWAEDSRTGQRRELWNPNPQFQQIVLGKASVYRWLDRSGGQWTGELVMPTDYVAGKRYPLVVQIYNASDQYFVTDGEFPTAMSARALSTAGIVVLQMQRSFSGTLSVEEASNNVVGIETAIEHLADSGLIDPHHVGLIGFSRTCWYVESALIKYPELIAAATIADGVDASYMQYHLWGEGNSEVAREYELINRAKPLGEAGMQEWLGSAPGFHLDRVRAAVRIEALGPRSILGEWEIYSSLRQQRKPVDLIYFPDGQHILQRPQERLASEQGNVDWFRFWLSGYQDPDPNKAEEYKRLRALKVLRDDLGIP
jgi:dipeptidyl aminopeptidase/acylaminoacyl peptidase